MREAGRASLQQANEMIRFADVKAAAVLAAAGVLAGQLPSAHGPLSESILLVAGACVALSALLALYTLAPRQQATAAWSLHYFENVAQRYGDDREAFIDAWLDASDDPDGFERAIAGQLWVANMVAYRKFVRITWSIRTLAVGVLAIAAVAVT
ncbi:Pycsar system effector family protein [Solwaraspora sp. WMMA2065]|uniref:Pycsar system effector family protein n=1 Tax=Micromonosporaceae TaxID=28056 RepID=UPI00259B141D|nr:Pycsar system effector family protein [Solwaraspora sp. WMMA2065]WJK36579.1 DUF5706 domain-containing protein [Solwaraspora sp. WMMA2065]